MVLSLQYPGASQVLAQLSVRPQYSGVALAEQGLDTRPLKVGPVQELWIWYVCVSSNCSGVLSQRLPHRSGYLCRQREDAGWWVSGSSV